MLRTKLFFLLSAVKSESNSTELVVREIEGMLSLVSPEYAGGQLFNYGCTGRGQLDPRSKNVGDPVDELDREINHWKQCRRCAKNYYESKEGQTANYLFDSQKHQCEDEAQTLSRSICECDYEFALNINGMEIQPKFQELDASNCTLRRARFRPNHGCCKRPSGSFVWYNADLRCCDGSGRLKAIGYCAAD